MKYAGANAEKNFCSGSKNVKCSYASYCRSINFFTIFADI